MKRTFVKKLPCVFLLYIPFIPRIQKNSITSYPTIPVFALIVVMQWKPIRLWIEYMLPIVFENLTISLLVCKHMISLLIWIQNFDQYIRHFSPNSILYSTKFDSQIRTLFILYHKTEHNMLGNFSLNVKSGHILHALSYCYSSEYVNFVMNESSEELPRSIPMEKSLK